MFYITQVEHLGSFRRASSASSIFQAWRFLAPFAFDNTDLGCTKKGQLNSNHHHTIIGLIFLSSHFIITS